MSSSNCIFGFTQDSFLKFLFNFIHFLQEATVLFLKFLVFELQLHPVVSSVGPRFNIPSLANEGLQGYFGDDGSELIIQDVFIAVA